MVLIGLIFSRRKTLECRFVEQRQYLYNSSTWHRAWLIEGAHYRFLVGKKIGREGKVKEKEESSDRSWTVFSFVSMQNGHVYLVTDQCIGPIPCEGGKFGQDV